MPSVYPNCLLKPGLAARNLMISTCEWEYMNIKQNDKNLTLVGNVGLPRLNLHEISSSQSPAVLKYAKLGK